MNTDGLRISETTPAPPRLEFQLERAQRAQYYAALYLRDHPGYQEARDAYRDAARRVLAIVAEIKQSDCPR